MKNNKIVLSTVCLTALLSISSCKKWIDVAPKTQVENSRFFSNQQGFVEGLNGVYLKMVALNMYGRDMTWGVVDVIGQTYNVTSSNGRQDYVDIANGLYTNTTPYSFITGMWSNTYNAIANLNNLIEQLNVADRSMFDAGKYNELKGEALGLRAFLHFDMVRLFTTSYKNGGAELQGVPYVTSYSATVTPRLTAKDAMAKVIADLSEAEELLKNDLIVTGSFNSSLTSAFDLRKERFNYFAVKATKARAYLWAQDETNALKEAEDVIATAPVKFPFITASALTVADPNKNRVFTTEHLFGLTQEKLQQNVVQLDSNTRNNPTFIISAARKNELYENNITDFRLQYLIRDWSADASVAAANRKVYFMKLIQPQNSKRQPLIKIPEMYYIAAECLRNTNSSKAVGYLNLVRSARGISSPLSNSLNGDQILAEIQKEYRKEMPNEGQIFYYYKRQNNTTISGVTGTYPAARYVLPLPLNEIDFGN